jgi:hypothetical protein
MCRIVKIGAGWADVESAVTLDSTLNREGKEKKKERKKEIDV